MGPSVPPYAKGKKKKIPIKKKFLPAPHPTLTLKETFAKVFLAGAKHRAGTHPGDLLQGGPGKIRGLGETRVAAEERLGPPQTQGILNPARSHPLGSFIALGLCTCHVAVQGPALLLQPPR